MDIYNGDAMDYISTLENNSIDCVITDPPYFLDANDEHFDELKTNSHISSLPIGMKYSKEQGKNLEKFMAQISEEVFRVLKPGGFFICFSAARMYHNVAFAIESANFEIRNQIIWHYRVSQVKASKQNHVIDRDKKMTKLQKFILKEKIKNYRTPLLKSNHEPICVAMKPIEGRFIDNFNKYGTGMIHLDFQDKVLSDVIYCNKPNKKEKGHYNNHPTVKPLGLIKELIHVFCPKEGIVLDPFLGSGTTMLASKYMGRICKGSEKNKDYCEIIRKRCS